MRFTTVMTFLAVAGALAFGGYEYGRHSFHAAAQAEGQAEQRANPQLIRNGERIAIPEGSPLRSKLTIATIAAREIQRTLLLPASVETDPARLFKVMPPLSGLVTRLDVQLGQRVAAGAPLVVLDSSDLGQAYADYDRAKTLLTLAQKTRDRQRELERIGGAAQKDRQQADADYATAEAEFERADARLRQIGANAQTTEKSRMVTVTAPVAGSVIDLQVARGTYWNDPTAALMTIADLSTIWVTASVPEKDTALVTTGQSADVTFPAYPGEVFKGQVLFVSDVLDPDTRRTKVRIALPNPNLRLKPNMFATVNFFAPKQIAPMIPTTALVLKDETDQVFVEVEPWVFEHRPVEVEFQQGDEVIVRTGLKAGDRVVARGGVLLND